MSSGVWSVWSGMALMSAPRASRNSAVRRWPPWQACQNAWSISFGVGCPGSYGLTIGLGRRHGAWPQLAGWLEQRAAQVLQQPQSRGGHGQAAPAGRGPVQDGPLAGASQLRPGQGNRPGGGLDRHLAVAITKARPGLLGEPGPLLAVSALGLQRSLHQQLCPEPGDTGEAGPGEPSLVVALAWSGEASANRGAAEGRARLPRPSPRRRGAQYR